jgi:hypothetical protein
MSESRVRSVSTEQIDGDADFWSADLSEIGEDEEDLGPIRALDEQHTLPE